jgi:hypothetical protein
MLLQRYAAESYEWAHWCCRNIPLMTTDGPTVYQKEMLPIVSYGPKVVPETCCWKLWMGLLVLPENAADGHGWANCFSKRNDADSVIWAQSCSRDMLLKAVNGPPVSPKKILLMVSNGPIVGAW